MSLCFSSMPTAPTLMSVVSLLWEAQQHFSRHLPSSREASAVPPRRVAFSRSCLHYLQRSDEIDPKMDRVIAPLSSETQARGRLPPLTHWLSRVVLPKPAGLVVRNSLGISRYLAAVRGQLHSQPGSLHTPMLSQSIPPSNALRPAKPLCCRWPFV